MSASPRIVLFHATPVAMEPIRAAFERGWPAAETVNLLDDSLSLDRARTSELSDDIVERFIGLGRHAMRSGADGILVTCSAFGPAIDRMIAEFPVPVLKPNEAMFRQALGQGIRIGMLATFAPSVSTMNDEFDEFVRETGRPATLDTIVVEDAMNLLRGGDADSHNRLVAGRAPEFSGHDAVMLAHFSTSRAAQAVRERVGVPVLSAPDAAVARMRDLIAGG